MHITCTLESAKCTSRAWLVLEPRSILGPSTLCGCREIGKLNDLVQQSFSFTWITLSMRYRSKHFLIFLGLHALWVTGLGSSQLNQLVVLVSSYSSALGFRSWPICSNHFATWTVAYFLVLTLLSKFEFIWLSRTNLECRIIFCTQLWELKSLESGDYFAYGRTSIRKVGPIQFDALWQQHRSFQCHFSNHFEGEFTWKLAPNCLDSVSMHHIDMPWSSWWGEKKEEQ